MRFKKYGNCEEELPSPDCWLSVGQQATDRPPTDDRQVTDSFPKQTFYCKIEQKKPELIDIESNIKDYINIVFHRNTSSTY